MDNGTDRNTAGTGIGFCGLLTILFIALKLTGVIAWSWVWVLAPMWIPIMILVAVVILIVVADERIR